MSATTKKIEIMIDGKIAIYLGSDFYFIDLYISADRFNKKTLQAIADGDIIGFYHTAYGDIYAKKVNGEKLCESQFFVSYSTNK